MQTDWIEYSALLIYTRHLTKVIEMEGPEWAVRDYCNETYSEFMFDEEYTIGEVFWMKIVLLTAS